MYLARKYLANCFLLGLISYFCFHAICGQRGGIAYLGLNRQFCSATSKLQRLEAERNQLEKRNSLLRPQSLDKDMLDEMARKVLNVGKPQEKIFNITEEKK